MIIEKDMCVSFVLEESDKGPSAKDVREEDPERVARVTAKVHYGKVIVRTDPLCLPTKAKLTMEEILRSYSKQAYQWIRVHCSPQTIFIWSS